MIESEFFAGAFYELISASFNSTVQHFLVESLKKSINAKKPSSNQLEIASAA